MRPDMFEIDDVVLDQNSNELEHVHWNDGSRIDVFGAITGLNLFKVILQLEADDVWDVLTLELTFQKLEVVFVPQIVFIWVKYQVHDPVGI